MAPGFHLGGNLPIKGSPVVLHTHTMRSLGVVACDLVILCSLARCIASASVDNPKCNPSDSRRAIDDLRHVAGWNAFNDAYKRYSQCDVGRVAEGYSYALGRLLAHEWKGVDLLLQLTASDPDFKQFVLRHIDENIPEEESQLIIRNAREQCPPGGEWLCKAIVDY